LRIEKAGPHCLPARGAAIQWDDAHVGSSWLPRKRAEVKALQIAIALPASGEGLRRRLRLVEFPAQWGGTKELALHVLLPFASHRVSRGHQGAAAHDCVTRPNTGAKNRRMG
jgi:hypothetical protein